MPVVASRRNDGMLGIRVNENPSVVRARAHEAMDRRGWLVTSDSARQRVGSAFQPDKCAAAPDGVDHLGQAPDLYHFRTANFVLMRAPDSLPVADLQPRVHAVARADDALDVFLDLGIGDSQTTQSVEDVVEG